MERIRFSLAVCSLFVAVLTSVACGGGDDTKTAGALHPTTDAPQGWKTFDYGAVAGAVPKDWDSQLMTADEFIKLTQQNVRDNKAFTEPLKDTIKSVDESEISGNVLLASHKKDGKPNINVQLCSPGAAPVSPDRADELIAFYKKTFQMDGVAEGNVTFNGSTFALVKLSVAPGISSFQAIVGTTECATVVTLATEPDNTAAVEVFKQFVSLLSITN